jgi:hypothetical protein
MGALRIRDRDDAPSRVIAKDLPGLNSLDFDRRNGKLYASQVFLGDALWEIDPAGAKPPRLIAKDLGGLNGFEVGPDGMIYGPLWFKRSVAMVDPASGSVTVINADFETPAAANLDGKGNLWVVDAATGELARVELASGRKTVVAKLKTALDNLAIAPDGTVYVSNMADNSIQAVRSGQRRGAAADRRRGRGAFAGIKVDGNTPAGWPTSSPSAQVDLASGAVSDVKRMHAPIPTWSTRSRSASRPSSVALTSWFTGWVQVLDRATLKTQAMHPRLEGAVRRAAAGRRQPARGRDSPPARSCRRAATATRRARPSPAASRGRCRWCSVATARSTSPKPRASSRG